jgi:uncharacterized small protein (DUF1192 family)
MTTTITSRRGTPGSKLGRTTGATNVITRELRTFWHNFFSSEEYRASAKRRILAGEAPHLENYLMARIYGKPKEQVDITVSRSDDEDLSLLSIDELSRRAAALALQLEEAEALEAALPAEYVTKTSVEAKNTAESDTHVSEEAKTCAESGIDTSVDAESRADDCVHSNEAP